VTALVDLQRLARVCGLFGSDHDGEALAAARQAEKIRKKLGLTWDELLVPSPRQRSGDPPPEDLTDWRWVCHFCLERYWLLVTAQVAGGSRTPEVCDQTVRVGVQGLQDIPTLLPGC
jgi:hypothetical protein